MKTPTWHIKNGWGMLQGGIFRCDVEIAHPDRGLQRVRVNNISMSSLMPLQISAQPPTPPGGEVILENYVRGSDLVATYAQTPARTVRPQIYWRSIQADSDLSSECGFVGIELWLSIQTSLLESDPALTVETRVGGSGELLGAWRGPDGNLRWETLSKPSPTTSPDEELACLLFRSSDGDDTTSYCEAIFPGDGQGAEWQSRGQEVEWRYRFDLPNLEKGVIRRGRVRGCFVPRRSDQIAAEACYWQMCQAPLPLTA